MRNEESETYIHALRNEKSYIHAPLRTFAANCVILSSNPPLILAFRTDSEKYSEARLHFVHTTARSLGTLTELLVIIAKGVVSL